MKIKILYQYLKDAYHQYKIDTREYPELKEQFIAKVNYQSNPEIRKMVEPLVSRPEEFKDLFPVKEDPNEWLETLPLSRISENCKTQIKELILTDINDFHKPCFSGMSTRPTLDDLKAESPAPMSRSYNTK